MKSRRRPKLQLGSLYAIPLGPDPDSPKGWAIALIVEHSYASLIPKIRFSKLPSAEEVAKIAPFDDPYTVIHGPVGVWTGEWKYVGKLQGWDQMHDYRGEFYCPNTHFVHSVNGHILRKAESEFDRSFPTYSVAGHGFLELWLDKRLPLLPDASEIGERSHNAEGH